MANTTEEIKEKLDIADVVGSYLKLEKSGKNFKGKCPFHNEKTPSFFVSPEKNSFYCFGCGASGDIFSFVEKIESVNFKTALKILADKAGVKINWQKGEKNKEEEALEDKMRFAMEEATIFYEKNLKENPVIKKYLTERGLKEETIKLWRLGFALNDWRTLKENLLKKGFDEKIILLSGLIKQKEEKNTSSYDTFRNRVMFPIFDTAGRVIAFSGRTMGDEKTEAKYLNSPETPIFKKSETLYGFQIAKHGIRKLDFAVLVEGQMDLLMSMQTGFTNTIASSGTALTEEHLKKIRRITNNLVIAFDSDNAGFKASKRAFEIALALGFNIKIADFQGKKDPADLAKENPEELKKAIKDSKNIIAFLWDKTKIAETNGEKALKIFKTEILPFLANIESKAEQARLIGEFKMSIVLGIREDYIWDEINKFQKNQPELKVENKNEEKEVGQKVEKIFVKIMGVLAKIEKEDNDFVKEMKEKIISIMGKETFEEYIKQLDKKIQKEEIESFIIFEETKDGKKYLTETMLNFEEEWLKKQLIMYLSQINKAEKDKDKDKVDDLLKRCQNVSLKINQLIKEKNG